MQQHREQQYFVLVNAERLLQQRQMAGAADWQELREPLHKTQNNRFKITHNLKISLYFFVIYPFALSVSAQSTAPPAAPLTVL